MNDITARLEVLFKDLFWDCTIPPAQMTRTNVVQWDSLAHLNLVLSIEQEFGVALSEEDILELNAFIVAAELLSEKLPTH